MKNIKSILLFLLTNIAIIAMLNLIIYLLSTFFGIHIFGSRGDIIGISIFAVIFGFGGAFINLLISRWMAKKIYRIKIVSANTSGKGKFVYDIVRELSHKYNIIAPEVGVYESLDLNAFATGSNKNKSLLAVSSGLLDQMTNEELKGVVGHEFAHIINGDMVKMTLLQGIINTFVIFLARVLAFMIDMAMSKNDDKEGGLGSLGYFLVVTVLDILLGFIGMLVLMRYSRQREYVADEGSSNLVGKQSMIQALEKLKKTASHKTGSHDEFSTLKISGGKNILHFLSSHPSLDDRIKHLKTIR